MPIDKILIELNTLLPSYDIRLFTLLFLLFILLSLMLLLLLKKKCNKRAYPILFVAITLIFSLTPPTFFLISGHQPSELLNKQFYLLELIYFVVIVLAITYFLILQIKGKSNRIIKGVTFSILIISFLLITIVSVFCEPRVLSNTANENGLLEESSSIEIEFTIPINKTI